MKKFIFILLLSLVLIGCDDEKQSEPNVIDVSMVQFKGETFVYNDTEYSIYCTNIPEGVTVDYVGNNKKEVGNHKVEAKLKSSTGEIIKTLTATMKIITHETIDVSMVVFEDDVVGYNGNSHSITCSNVPSGVTVDYIGNEVATVGEHEVIAVLKDRYGNEIKRLTATLTIKKVITATLDIPVLTITEDGIVTWNSVDRASHYNYIINDGSVLTTTQTVIKLEDGQSISVQASSEYEISKWSNAITYFDTSERFVEGDDVIYVKFHNTSLSPIVLTEKGKIAKPEAPLKEYYTFDNWYKDPYYMEVFDFEEEIVSSTIIYANYIPTELMNNTYYWVKASSHITSSVMSNSSSSGWHFIPLKLNSDNTKFKEFVVTITVSGASTTNPASFIIMDGFNDGAGRTYWKNGENDFSITTNGSFNIYFTLEEPYSANINAKYVAATISETSPENNPQALKTPIVSIDKTNNKAFWDSVENGVQYEVIIDNGEVILTDDTFVNINVGSHIVVRAVKGNLYSNWSFPKAYIKNTVVDTLKTEHSVYFVGYDSYMVEDKDSITPPTDPTKEKYTFGGWYLDISCTNKASFPYLVTSNVVFYPKWEALSDYETKIYYNIVTNTGEVVGGLTWNLDNYTYLEYETHGVELTSGTEYYVISTDNSQIKYGPYKVDKTSKYNLYFSEDNLWGDSNIYVEDCVKRIYLSNVKGWGDTIYAYVWNSSTGKPLKNWPGTVMAYLENNEYGQGVYYIDVDFSSYDSIIFSHGTGNDIVTQTVDIKLNKNGDNGYYVTEKVNGKYEYATYKR